MLLAEAGTGVGKTMAYLAPASLWAEANGPAVWISTYTRALQRQIERESHAVYPDPEIRKTKAVVRKGRENYLCLLNLQDAVNAAQLGNGDLIGIALAARWARATRDGDMTGGDFPAWLPTLFAVGAGAQASAANLVDRRGECIHAGCIHYRACFIEKAVRASRRADLVIANHALVLTQAAFDGARAARGAKQDGESAHLKRIVFDEGHHLFDAADSAFSAALSGQEAAEMRRWIRGPESRGRRGRGHEQRLMDLVGGREDAKATLLSAIRAAAALPGEGWSGRIAPPSGEANPIGPLEAFLTAALEQLRARAAPSELGQECAARPAIDLVRDSARAAAKALADIEAPLLALARRLEDILDEEADTLPPHERGRIEGALRGLDRRARMTLPAWRSMLRAIDEDSDDDPDFVDWFESTFAFGRVVDAAYRRHWVDPTEPLNAAVIAPAHGVLVTSATLADPALEDPFALAEMRTGAARLPDRPKTLRLASPFDYAANARAFVVNDIGRDDPRQVAAAMRELFLAAGGGGLGLFTAIRRLRTVYDKIAAPLAEKGVALYAQHVDPLEVGALVDIFRAEAHACLLGTDAVRDGVDVPGRSLRLLVFDRVPWPRPDLLHKARRGRFGGKGYDDTVARGRIAQAFGRLIRRADDKGVFVMLDAAAPTRLFSSLPEGVQIERVGLVAAIEATAEFLAALSERRCDDPNPTELDLFTGFLWASVRGCGGEFVMGRRMLVEERRWLTADEFVEILGVCQFLPGAEYRQPVGGGGPGGSRGWKGSLAALAGILLAPAAISIMLAALFMRYAAVPQVAHAMGAVAATAAGLVVIGAALQMAEPIVRKDRVLALPVAIGTLVLAAFLRWPLPAVLLLMAGAGSGLAYARRAQ